MLMITIFTLTVTITTHLVLVVAAVPAVGSFLLGFAGHGGQRLDVTPPVSP